MNILRLLKPKSTVIYLHADNTMLEGLHIMQQDSYTALPVIGNDGQYLGTVSEGDFLWKLMASYPNVPDDLGDIFVSELVRPDFNPAVKISITMDELLQHVMSQNFVPVVDDRGSFVGIVTRRDVLKYFYKKGRLDKKFKPVAISQIHP